MWDRRHKQILRNLNVTWMKNMLLETTIATWWHLCWNPSNILHCICSCKCKYAHSHIRDNKSTFTKHFKLNTVNVAHTNKFLYFSGETNCWFGIIFTNDFQQQQSWSESMFDSPWFSKMENPRYHKCMEERRQLLLVFLFYFYEEYINHLIWRGL